MIILYDKYYKISAKLSTYCKFIIANLLKKKDNDSMNSKNMRTTMALSTIDHALFEESCNRMIGALSGQNGIGTLQEKTIHSVLKYYYAPNPSYHEIKIGSYVADICIDGEIFEVQTRNFNTMRNKLDFFLKEHDVTIIYPVAHTKWLSWLDMETGELSKKRKSPKTGTFYQIIPELYKIKM